jgi:hypothetical protein
MHLNPENTINHFVLKQLIFLFKIFRFRVIAKK